jgi:hypothetical protein
MAPALPPDAVTRVESENQAPAEELTHVADAVDPLTAGAANQPPRRLPWPLVAAIAGLIALGLYLFLGR